MKSIPCCSWRNTPEENVKITTLNFHVISVKCENKILVEASNLEREEQKAQILVMGSPIVMKEVRDGWKLCRGEVSVRRGCPEEAEMLGWAWYREKQQRNSSSCSRLASKNMVLCLSSQFRRDTVNVLWISPSVRWAQVPRPMWAADHPALKDFLIGLWLSPFHWQILSHVL